MVNSDPGRGARLSAVGLGVTVGLGILALVVAFSTRSHAAFGAAVHVLAGSLVWLGTLLYESRRARARSEELELVRLEALAREGRRSLFGSAEGRDQGGAGERVARFVRFGAPALAVVLALSELGFAWFLLRAFPHPLGVEVGPALAGAAALCGSAFAFLVLGRYGFALSNSGLPSAAAGGRRATSASLALFLGGVALAVQDAGFAGAEVLGYAFAGLEGLLGVEVLVLLLLELYRPRRADEVARPAYDSRLLGLLSAPKDLARTIAHAVDYQFGFALSQTWFYRFLQRRVLPLVGFAVLAFWLLSVFVTVGPHEHVVVRRFGSPTEPLGPGLHLKLPWPFDAVQRVQSGRVHTLVTGGHFEADDHDAEEGPRAILWTEGGEVHGGEDESLVLLARRSESADGSTPVNLLVAAATVHYELVDVPAFLTHVEDPHALLEVLAERELSFLLSGADLDQLLRQRGVESKELSGRLQKAADGHGLGIRILSASLTDLHPPSEVGEAFEEVTVAHEESQTAVLKARIEEEELLPRSRGEAAARVSEAKRAAERKVELARADAERFKALRELDDVAPDLWRMARLLDRLTVGAKDRRKVVLTRPGGALTELDLQEKVSVEEIGLGRGASPAGAESEEDQK